MSKSLDKNPTDKAKELLGISSSIEINNLYNQLYNYRLTQHPDRFTDEDARKIAEENFKEAGVLLDALKASIEKQIAKKKPSDIIPIQKDLDTINVKQENRGYQDKIRDLELRLDIATGEVTNLKKELHSLQRGKVRERTEDLVKHYKPTTQKLLTLGITFLFSLIISILSKVEEIALFIAKYSPIDQRIINATIFGLLLFVPSSVIWLYLKQNILNRYAKLIVSPPYVKDFLFHLDTEKDKEPKDFTENDVFEYLEYKLGPFNRFLRFITRRVLGIHSVIATDSLKDIFIYNLLSKRLIEISNANMLERRFSIVKSRYYHFNLDDFDLEDL